MSAILDALQFAGNVLDTPGSVARGLLAGEGGRAMRGVFNPDERVGGREMLQNWGVLGENTEGLDWGDVAGFGAEMVADPLNFIGGTGLLKALRNPKMVLQKGPHHITDDVLRNTKVVDELGNPKRMLHGTASSYDWPDVKNVAPEDNLFGRGFYMTDDPHVTSSLNNKPLADYMAARSLDIPQEGIFNPYSETSITRDTRSLRPLGVKIPMDNTMVDTGSYIEARAIGQLEKNRALMERAESLGRTTSRGIDNAVNSALIHEGDRMVGEFSGQKFLPENKDILTKAVQDQLPGKFSGGRGIRDLIGEAEFMRGTAQGADALPPVNTRMHFADVRNPLNIDGPVDYPMFQQIAEKVREKYSHVPAWETGVWGYGGEENPLSHLFNNLQSAAMPSLTPPSTGNDLYLMLQGYLPKDEINPLLQQVGFDGIRHVGGTRVGSNRLHDVWIPFSQDQLYLPFMPPRVPEMNRAVAPLVGALGTQNALRPWGE